MLENIKLRELYIGDTDGNMEAQAEDFTELFFDVDGKYNELLNDNNKFFIIGDKGTGKTYLANYICKKKTRKQHYEIQDAKKYWIVELVDKGEKESEHSKYLLCKWFLLEMIAKYIIHKVHPIKARYFKPSPQYKLKNYMDKLENLDFFRDQVLSSEVSELSEVGLNGTLNNADRVSSFGGTYKSSSGQNTKTESKRKDVYEHLNPFEELIKNSIGCKDDVILIFDDLDELDKKLVEKPTTDDMILNLIKCVHDINYEFIRNKKKFRIILLLRRDIIEKLQKYDANLNKRVTSNGIDLYWMISDKTSPENHPLMKMIIHKARTTCKKLSGCNDKEIYNKLFPENINNKTPLQYLLDLSFGRPRDFIMYLNHVIKRFPENGCFNASAMKSISALYSSDLFNELNNQLLFHREPEFSEDCIRLLRGIRKSTFSYLDAKMYFEKNNSEFHNISNLNDCLEFLYANGVIGNTWINKKNNNKRYFYWAYRRDASQTVNFKKDFVAHPGLKKKILD